MTSGAGSKPVRIAMWSGPRNISTALMRSWGNRPDTFVCDEPFYAHYLRETGVGHPGAEEVLASQENDWRKVADWLTGEVPEGKTIFYQKHMAHHLLPHMAGDWLLRLSNALLIRDPREMLTSLLKVTPDASVADTGLLQQWELFEKLREEKGQAPPVIDSRDVLENPRGILEKLCEALGVPFLEEMLSWPPGRRATDGVWAKYWYEAVEQSTGFSPYRPKADEVPPGKTDIYEACERYYKKLYAHRITV